MEEIKPKKERKFLKAVGNIAKVLANELVMGIARKFIGKAIDKVGNKRQGLSMALIIIASTFAIAQYPTTSNKQRLGFQTTGDGLTWRGSISDTASIQPINNQNAWIILDTVNLKIYSFDFTSNVWNLISGAGGGLTMPFDSITFNTAKDGTVGVGEVEYNDTQGSLIQGLKGGNVTNVIGQQLHQRVNNRTGASLAKGTVVYLAGSQGNRITVAKALGVTDAFSANTFGIVAEDILNNQSGYVITEGLIKDINTSALVEDSAVYLSPTVAGGLTSTKPQAPQHTVYIGVCVKSNAGSGELFVKIRNGQELDELHDVRITLPVDKASLYYSGGLWRDTTAALLVSDTATMLSNYPTKAYIDTSGRFYARQDFLNVSSSTLTWTQEDKLITGNEEILQIYRNGQILLPNQYTVTNDSTLIISATSYKIGENYTVLFPRGGGGLGTVVSVTPSTTVGNPITITNTTTTPVIELLSATNSRNGYLSSVDWTTFNNKLNISDTVSLSNRINLRVRFADTSYMLTNYIKSNVNLTSQVTGILPLLNGGTGSSTQSGARTNLGGTGIGQYLFTLSNSGTNKYARFDATNQVTLLTSSELRTDIGAGTGNGTVTSVGLSLPSTNSIFSLSGSPITTSGTLALTYSGTALPLLNGGTGATTAAAARTALGVPSSAITISTSSPLSGGGDLSANRAISISQSSGSVNGFLSSTDWTTFNNKQNAITLTTTGTSGAATLTGATLNIPQYSGGSGTVTNISVTSPLTITNPTTTPLIQINAANGTSSSGVVTTVAQQFGGAKTFNANLTTNGNMQVDGTLNVGSTGTFGGRVKTNWLERNYAYSTSSSFTISANTTWQDINTSVLTTITLPNAATYPGKEIYIRQSGGGSLQSASSNIIPFQTPPTGSTSTGILTASFHRAVTLVSDGTNWIIMQRSDI